MSYTQDDLIAINEAITTGATNVKIDGREIGYRPLKELLQIKKMIQDDLAGTSDATSETVQPARIQATYSKGRSE